MTEKNGTAVADQPLLDTSGAPFPSKRTLAKRQNVLFQFLRFVGISLRIMGMVVKGHKGE